MTLPQRTVINHLLARKVRSIIGCTGRDHTPREVNVISLSRLDILNGLHDHLHVPSRGTGRDATIIEDVVGNRRYVELIVIGVSCNVPCDEVDAIAVYTQLEESRNRRGELEAVW